MGVKNSKDYSSHSLRRGASTHAFKSGVAECTIMQMGGWKSNCYRRYIEVGVDSRLAAWKKFTNNFSKNCIVERRQENAQSHNSSHDNYRMSGSKPEN